MFGEHFDNQKEEIFPSRFRKQDYSSPKFVQQQKQRMVPGFRFSQIMEASLYTYDSPVEMTTQTITEQSPKFESIQKLKSTESQNKFKTKQYIVFPKIQQSIREQYLQNRNNVLLQFGSSPHSNLMQNKSIAPDTLKMIYSQPYIHSSNVKKIRRISSETKMNHVCKKSVIIPQQDGNYAMPGLPNSENRSKKLNNLSYTKMQWNITNYNANFALSKKEQEIRDIIKQSKIKRLSQDQSKDYSQDHVLSNTQGQQLHINQEQTFNFLTAYSKTPQSGQVSPQLKQSPQNKTRDFVHA